MARAGLAATAKDMFNNDDDGPFRPPLRTLAGLMFPARSKFTVRGFTLAQTPAEQHWRQIIYASQGERETCLLLLADLNLWNLFEQPKTVSYLDDQGRMHSHRFDFLAEFRNGHKVGVAVKPKERVEKLNFRQTLAAIRRDLPKSFADQVYLVTEQNRHPTEVMNAELLNFFRRCPDAEADARISEQISGLTEECSIHALITPSELGARGFRAAFRAIYAGLLQANTRERITTNSIIAPRKENT